MLLGITVPVLGPIPRLFYLCPEFLYMNTLN
jgi:hypothetical protein